MEFSSSRGQAGLLRRTLLAAPAIATAFHAPATQACEACRLALSQGTHGAQTAVGYAISIAILGGMPFLLFGGICWMGVKTIRQMEEYRRAQAEAEPLAE